MSLTESGISSDVFTFPARISILFIVQAACLSALGIIGLFAYKLYHSISRARRARGLVVSEDACDSSLFVTLMVGEALRAVGKIMSVRWMVQAKISAPTTFCSSQGIIQLLATNLVDWSTLGITVQTFVVLVIQWNAPIHFATYLALGVWAVVGLIVGTTIGVKGISIIGPAGSWCWILPQFRFIQIISEYLWMWIILILTIVFYGIDALVIMGYVTIEKGFRLRWVSRNRVHLKLTEASSIEEKASKEMAVQLLFYPLVYFICVFPFSITHWLTFAGFRVPHQLAAFTSCLFTLSGLFNVILFFKTRPQLITGGDIVDVDTAEGHAMATRPPGAPQYDHRKGKLPMDRGDELVLSVPTYPYTSQHGDGRRRREEEEGFGRGGHNGLAETSQSSSRSRDTDEDDDQGYLPPT